MFCCVLLPTMFKPEICILIAFHSVDCCYSFLNLCVHLQRDITAASLMGSFLLTCVYPNNQVTLLVISCTPASNNQGCVCLNSGQPLSELSTHHRLWFILFCFPSLCNIMSIKNIFPPFLLAANININISQ